MTIIHFANHFLPRIGGVELSVARTAEAQALRGHDVTVVAETPSTGSDTQFSFAVRRFSVPVVRPLTRLLYWRWMWQQRHWLNAADVLHFHDYTTFIHWFLPLRLVIRHPRYAVTFHGFEGWPLRLRHRAFRTLTAMCVHTRFAVGSYISKYYGHAVDAVYLGAPARSLPVMSRGSGNIFAFVGRLAADTGILEFAQDLRLAAQGSGSAVELRLAGEGPLRSELEQLNSPLFRVHMPGAVEYPSRVYEGSRFIIATGFLSILEAFQTGIPVLIPAFSEFKQNYVRSIEGIGKMATVLNDRKSAPEMLEELLTAKSDTSTAEQRAAAAGLWIITQTWDNVAALLELHYHPDHTVTSKGTIPQGRIGICA